MTAAAVNTRPTPGRYQVGGQPYEVTARPDGGIRILRVASKRRWVVAGIRPNGSLWLRTGDPETRRQIGVLLAHPDRALVSAYVTCADCGTPLTAEASRRRGRGSHCETKRRTS